MFFLSRQTVRRHLSLYAGSFVALAVGVFLLGLAATATAATVAYHGPAGRQRAREPSGRGRPRPHQERVLLSGADASGCRSCSVLVGVISGFITIFVIASTFAFAVASRRREVGLLRLIGATPRQVRRMVLGEAVVVAVAASLTGALLAQLFTPLVLAKASYTELAPVKLEAGEPVGAAGDRGRGRAGRRDAGSPVGRATRWEGRRRSTRCGRRRWNRRGSAWSGCCSGCCSWPVDRDARADPARDRRRRRTAGHVHADGAGRSR